jgi:ABC-type nitrate/sulfonate/bicarbonate transport system permease component
MTPDVIRVSMTIVELFVGLGIAFVVGFAVGMWARL